MGVYNLKTSPFLELDRPFTAYEAFKMVLLLPLLPFRVVLGVSVMCLVAIINTIAGWGVPEGQPLSVGRRQLVLFSKELMPFVFWMIGFHVTVKGRENIEKAQKLGAVGVFTHIAWFDAFALLWLMAPSGVAKDFNAKLPIIKHAIRAVQNVYVPTNKLPRSSPRTQPQQSQTATPASTNGATSSSASLSTSAGAISALLQARVDDPRYLKPGGFPMLMLAPEGTTDDGKCLLQFRTGAFVLGRPVLPVLLKYHHRHHNPAWTNCNELWHFVRLMCQFVNRLEIRVLPPYIPSPDELRDPRLYADNVRALMARELGVPLSRESQSEFMRLGRAKVRVAWDGRRVLLGRGMKMDEEWNIELPDIE